MLNGVYTNEGKHPVYASRGTSPGYKYIKGIDTARYDDSFVGRTVDKLLMFRLPHFRRYKGENPEFLITCDPIYSGMDIFKGIINEVTSRKMTEDTYRSILEGKDSRLIDYIAALDKARDLLAKYPNSDEDLLTKAEINNLS